MARGGLPAAPLRNTGPSEAAEQGRGRLSGPSPDNPRFVPAASAPAQPPPCPESEAAGLAAPLGGRQPAWGGASGMPWAAPTTPARTWVLGSQRPTLGPPPSAGWPGRIGRPVGAGGLAGPVTGEGSPAGLVRRRQPTLRPRTSCRVQATPGTTRGAGGPHPPPKPSMGPGRCWPMRVRHCNWPSGPHRGRGGA